MTSTDAIADQKEFVLHASLDGITPPEEGFSDRDRVLNALPYLARKLTGADYAALARMDDTGRIREMFTSGISQDQADKIGTPPVGKGLLGFMNPEGDPLLLEKISDHPASTGFPANHPPMESILGVAVENDGRHAANLYLANKPGSPAFTESDVEIVNAVSQLAATALENARLYRQEETLRNRADEARSWLEAVIEQASVGILVVDASSGDVLVSSPEAERIMGIELKSGTVHDRYHHDLTCYRSDGARFDNDDLPLHQTRITGRPTGPVEIVCQRPDGRRIPTLVSAAPIPSAGTRGGAVIAVVQDVTNLKELDEVKAEFLSMITHDLRSPLATIKGLTRELAMALADDPDLLADSEAIDEEVDQTIDLVSNLLDMSRIEAGSYPIDPEIAHFVDMTDDAVGRALRSRLGVDRNIKTNVPLDLPPAFADPSQMGRVLDNLISNALKYSADDISVAAAYESEMGLIRTTVQDSGVGIPSSHIDSVFDKFFRVTGGAAAGRGAGLGLAICKAIVEAHGGAIGVDSEPGNGSTFWFTVPAYSETRSGSAGDDN